MSVKNLTQTTITNTSQSIIQLKDIRKLWQMFMRGWYIIPIALLLAFGSYLYYLYSHPEDLLAKLQISLKYNKENTKDYSDYSEEMTGINAPSLINKTIENLQMGVSYFQKKENVYEELYDSIPFRIKLAIISPELEDKYLRFKIINEKIFEISYSKGEKQLVEIGHFDSAFVSADLRFAEVTNKKGYFSDNEYYIQVHNRNNLISQCQSDLKTELTKDLAVLQVTYRDALPKRAIAFLDTLSRIYLNNTIKSQLDRNSKTVIGIERLLTGTESILRNVEDSLRKYKQKTGIFNSSYEDQKYVSILTELMLDKKNLELQSMSLKDIESYLIENKDAMGLPPPYYGQNSDAFITKSVEELYQLQLSKKQSLFDITDKGKSIDRIDKTYEDRKNDLLKYIKNSQKLLQEKMGYIEKQAEKTTPAKQNYNKDQLYVLDLERQLKVNETMYMNLLERKNNILVSQAAMAPEYKIFESAHLVSPTNISKRKVLLYHLLIGLLVGMIITYIKSFFFERIESIEDLKAKTTLPVLGEMPYLDLKKDALANMKDAYTHPLASSLLRTIRTNLEFISSGEKSKVILITSHNSGEGKTFNAVNLGAILAIANKKVLLLDMDLHKPNMSNTLGLEVVDNGIISLYNQKREIPQAIINAGIKNLDVIITEKSIKEGSELLLSETTEKIIEYGKNNYDYIIIDTPPVGLISDALNLMKYSDINIYILNSASPYQNALTQAHEIIEKNDFPIHFILNKVQLKKLQYYSKQYKNYRYAYAS